MTRFAAPSVYQCPECEGYLLWPQPLWIPSLRFTRWSDDIALSTDLRNTGSVTCCASCPAILWSTDVQALGKLRHEPPPLGRFTRMLAEWNADKHGYLNAEREWQAQDPAWTLAQYGRQLNYVDLRRALDEVNGTHRDRELYLRRRIWRATNDHMRKRSVGTCATKARVAAEAERRDNMTRLIALLVAAGTDIAERAELLRQLARFDEAIRLLKSGAPEIRSSATAAWILRWAKAGDAELKAFR